MIVTMSGIERGIANANVIERGIWIGISGRSGPQQLPPPSGGGRYGAPGPGPSGVHGEGTIAISETGIQETGPGGRDIGRERDMLAPAPPSSKVVSLTWILKC